MCVCFIPVLLYLLFGAFTEGEILHRSKRAFFLYPRGGQFKLVVGVAIPVSLGLKQNMGFGLNLQFQYAVATNISQIQVYPPIISKKKRSPIESDRAIAYLGLEAIIKKYGLNGRTCLLKAICDNAADSLRNQANGVYGHLLHIFLTPDYGDGEVDADLDPIYFEAQKAGNYGADCNSLYPECLDGNGILDMISFLGQ